MDVGDIVRPPAELVEGFRRLSTGTISNALDKLGIAGSMRNITVTGKTRIKMLAVNQPIRVDGISVRPGDIIVGDGSGVTRVPIEIAAEILELARKQDAADEQVIEWVRRGLPFSEALQRAGVRWPGASSPLATRPGQKPNRSTLRAKMDESAP
jgi:hypothetical protein